MPNCGAPAISRFKVDRGTVPPVNAAGPVDFGIGVVADVWVAQTPHEAVRDFHLRTSRWRARSASRYRAGEPVRVYPSGFVLGGDLTGHLADFHSARSASCAAIPSPKEGDDAGPRKGLVGAGPQCRRTKHRWRAPRCCDTGTGAHSSACTQADQEELSVRSRVATGRPRTVARIPKKPP
jgi:hypothetical protein